MKSRLFVFVLAFVAGVSPAQRSAPIDAPRLTDKGSSSNYSILERGANHRTWQKVSWTTNAAGKTFATTNRYTELEMGIHHFANGQWVESTTDISMTADGAAVTNAGHQVFFSANLNTTMAVRLVTPDDKTLSSHVLCLSYFDPPTGSNAIIAELQDSVGQLQAPDKVLYTNAFSGECSGDILYVNTKAGLEQNVILRRQLPAPATYGLPAEGIMLQVWTEFIDPPVPSVVLGTGAFFGDRQLDFGVMKIGPGRAFLIGDNDKAQQGVRVFKEWVVLQNRTFLVEQVPLDSIIPQLAVLPPPIQGTNSSQGALLRRGSAKRFLPPVRMARRANDKMHFASFDPMGHRGFLLDYSSMSSVTNWTFRSDTTYYIGGSMVLSGSNTFEGGAVLKFATNGVINVYPTFDTPTLNFMTDAYRRVICTAKDDDSVGEPISGSTGSPTGFYAKPAFLLAGIPAPTFSYVRIAYANQGISLAGNNTTMLNVQFVKCQSAIVAGGTATVLRNVLFANNQTNFLIQGGAAFSAENATFSGSAYLATAPSGDSGSSLALTNCVLANITNLTVGTLPLSGAFNAFYNTAMFGSSTSSVSSYPFQTVGGGSYYLADNSPCRNVGTTNVYTNLLADLNQKTTYPPVVFYAQTLTNDLTLFPQAQRDTDAPDLGYHYDPLDYAIGHVWLKNATFTIKPGTAIGTFANSSGFYGFSIASGSRLLCEGTPNQLNRIVRTSLVQEQCTTNWNYLADSILGPYNGTSIAPQASFRFTAFSMPADSKYQFWGSEDQMSVSFSDCQFHSGKVVFYSFGPAFTNCLLERVDARVDDDLLGGPIDPVLQNNFLFGGTLTLNHYNGDTWLFRDNLFDNTAIVQGGDVDNGYNGYITGSSRLSPTNAPINAHDVVSTLTYKVGPLGNYYQPTNSAFIDKGSVTANLVGLYHYTTATNFLSSSQIKETNSVVDIGLHYVALNSNYQPIDSDSDLVPDYLEDANGNGSVDSGETDGQSPTDLGLKVLITRPKNGSGIP